MLGRRDDVSPWLKHQGSRTVVFATGIAVALIALQSPIDRAGDEYLFAMHMLQHLLLMMLAPPLLLLGIVGMRPLPERRLRALRRVWWALTRPWVAVVVFNIVMLVWHIPALYDTTLTVEPVHIMEHISFIAVGIVFWWAIVDPIRGPATKPVSPLEKIAAMVVAGIPPTVLGLIFALSPVAFYDFYVRAPRLWGIGVVADQSYGGVLMLGLGNLIYFVAITIIFVRLLGDAAGDEEEAALRLQTPAPRDDAATRIASRRMVPAGAEGPDAAPERPVPASIEGGSR